MTRIAAAVTVGIALLLDDPASACRCPKRTNCGVSQADILFEGAVLSIEPVEIPFGDAKLVANHRVSFEVRRLWRGKAGKTLTLMSGDGCGYTFERGRVYVVEANLRNGRLETNMCTCTQLASEELRRRLGLGSPPSDGQ